MFKMRVGLLLINFTFAAAENMNHGTYQVANSDIYKTSFESREYFDVYSPPIKTRYSEVYWRMQEAVPLSKDIQERFADKIMAVTGYEVDQVRLTPQGTEVPVPITWAYNHHYGGYLSNSKKTEFVKRPAGPDRMFMNHNSKEYWAARMIQDDDDDSEIPLHIFFSEGNGGEFRLSYHGYPRGYAQLIESPDTFFCNPMQIDTWNRDEPSSKYAPGPLPKSSRIPPSAGYSGLIECPCTDRLEIMYNMTYALVNGEHVCTGEIQNATECFFAVAQVVPGKTQSSRTISETSKPHGCSAKQYSDGTVEAIWNAASNARAAPRTVNDDHATQLIAFSHAQVNVTVELDSEQATIQIVGPPHKWFGVAFGSSTMCVHLVSDECPDGGPYAIVVSGDDFQVTERKLGFHGPGSMIENTVHVVSNSVQDGNRTVVVTRPLQGASRDHYTFDLTDTTLPIITARGCSPEFAQHCGHGPSELNFLAVGTPKRVCQAGISGTIGGDKFLTDRCAPSPFSDLQTQHNPTCAIQTYRGGLSCCRDGKPLLDQDQEVPWADQYLEYRLKFRFYFEEYKEEVKDVQPASHYSLIRLYWQTEAHAGEYDINQCSEDTPRSQCIQVITSRWAVRDMMKDCSLRPDAAWCTGKGSTDGKKTEGVKLIYAAPHCHAPSCLSMELYNADTGQLLCRVEPVFGQGQGDKEYDEQGFLAIPPCLWADKEEGLSPPQLLTLNTTLLSIKRNNSTLPHTGEMASWQMRGILVPKNAGRTFMPSSETLTETDEAIAVGTIPRGQLRRETGN
jgi:hypothetical protein